MAAVGHRKGAARHAGIWGGAFKFRGERGFLRLHVRAPRSDARASPSRTPSPNSRKPRAGAASPGMGGALAASAYVIKKRPRGCSRLVGREVASDWLAVGSPSYWLMVGALR